MIPPSRRVGPTGKDKLVYELLLAADPFKRKGDPRYESMEVVLTCYETDANLIVNACTRSENDELLDGMTAERVGQTIVRELRDVLGEERVRPAEAALLALGEKIYGALLPPVRLEFRTEAMS